MTSPCFQRSWGALVVAWSSCKPGKAGNRPDGNPVASSKGESQRTKATRAVETSVRRVSESGNRARLKPVSH